MTHVKKITFSAMFLALGLILPFFTGQIPQIGSMLLPMHIPVLLCGMICGSGWGGLIGFITPLLRYVLFGMPPIFPKGVSMAFELAVYGMVVGLLYQHAKKKGYATIYRSLILAMIAGRIVWGIVFAILVGFTEAVFTFRIFMMSAFVEAIPGIIIQLILIPVLIKHLEVTYERKNNA